MRQKSFRGERTKKSSELVQSMIFLKLISNLVWHGQRNDEIWQIK